MIRHLIVWGVVLMTLTGFASAETLVLDEKLSTMVAGTVTDNNGAPIPGYPVIISRENDEANVVVFTGKDGAYLVEGLGEGTYIATPGTNTEAQIEFSIETAPKRRWLQSVEPEMIMVPGFAVPTGKITR